MDTYIMNTAYLGVRVKERRETLEVSVDGETTWVTCTIVSSGDPYTCTVTYTGADTTCTVSARYSSASIEGTSLSAVDPTSSFTVDANPDAAYGCSVDASRVTVYLSLTGTNGQIGNDGRSVYVYMTDGSSDTVAASYNTDVSSWVAALAYNSCVTGGDLSVSMQTETGATLTSTITVVGLAASVTSPSTLYVGEETDLVIQVQDVYGAEMTGEELKVSVDNETTWVTCTYVSTPAPGYYSCTVTYTETETATSTCTVYATYGGYEITPTGISVLTPTTSFSISANSVGPYACGVPSTLDVYVTLSGDDGIIGNDGRTVKIFMTDDTVSAASDLWYSTDASSYVATLPYSDCTDGGTLSVTLETETGAYLTSSITVVGKPDPDSTSVDVNPINAIAGTAITQSVVLYDSASSAAGTQYALYSTVTLDGTDTNTECSVSDDVGGTYLCQMTFYSDEQTAYTLYVDYTSHTTTVYTGTVSVGAGAADVGYTQTYYNDNYGGYVDTSPEYVTVDNEFYLGVGLSDAYGNQLTESDSASISVSGTYKGSAADTQFDCTWSDTHFAFASTALQETMTGEYEVVFMVDGTALTLKVAVYNGVPVAESSSVSPLTGVAGEDVQLSVSAFDASNNGCDSMELRMAWTTKDEGAYTETGTSGVFGYEMTCPTVAQDYQLVASYTYEDADFDESTDLEYTFTVTPGAASAISLSSSTSALVSGEQATLTVYVTDQYGNAVGGEELEVSVDDETNYNDCTYDSNSSPVSYMCTVTYSGDKNVIALYSQYDDMTLPSVNVAVSGGTPDSGMSSITPLTGVYGKTLSYTVLLKTVDSLEILNTPTAHSVSMSILSTDTSGTDCVYSDTALGWVCTVTFGAYDASNPTAQSLYVYVDGGLLLSGAIDMYNTSPSSTHTLVSPSKCTVGEDTLFYVKLYNENGDNVGDASSFTVTGNVEGTTATFTYDSVTSAYTATIAGPSSAGGTTLEVTVADYFTYSHSLAVVEAVVLTGESVDAPTSVVQGDGYGDALSVHDEYMLVGAPTSTVSAFTNAGAAYLMNTETGSLDVVLELPEAVNASENEYLGYSVCLLETIGFIGAPGTDSVYVISRPDDDSTDWQHKNTLYGTYMTAFGKALSCTETDSEGVSRLIVGAPDAESNVGSVSLYECESVTGACTLDKTYTPTTSEVDLHFGTVVDISTDSAVVGCEGNKTYIFRRSTSLLTWSLEATLDIGGGSAAISQSDAASVAFVADTASGSSVFNVYGRGDAGWSVIQSVTTGSDTSSGIASVAKGSTFNLSLFVKNSVLAVTDAAAAVVSVFSSVAESIEDMIFVAETTVSTGDSGFGSGVTMDEDGGLIIASTSSVGPNTLVSFSLDAPSYVVVSPSEFRQGETTSASLVVWSTISEPYLTYLNSMYIEYGTGGGQSSPAFNTADGSYAVTFTAPTDVGSGTVVCTYLDDDSVSQTINASVLVIAGRPDAAQTVVSLPEGVTQVNTKTDYEISIVLKSANGDINYETDTEVWINVQTTEGYSSTIASSEYAACTLNGITGVYTGTITTPDDAGDLTLSVSVGWDGSTDSVGEVVFATVTTTSVATGIEAYMTYILAGAVGLVFLCIFVSCVRCCSRRKAKNKGKKGDKRGEPIMATAGAGSIGGLRPPSPGDGEASSIMDDYHSPLSMTGTPLSEGKIMVANAAAMVGENVPDGVLVAGGAMLAASPLNAALEGISNGAASAVQGVGASLGSIGLSSSGSSSSVMTTLGDALSSIGGVEVFGVCFAILAKAAQMMRTMKETQEQAALILRRMVSLKSPLEQLAHALADSSSMAAEKLQPGLESVKHIAEVLQDCDKEVTAYFIDTSNMKKFIMSTKFEREFGELMSRLDSSVADLTLALQVLSALALSSFTGEFTNFKGRKDVVSMRELKLKRVLGEGAFGQVWLVKWRSDHYAVKLFKRNSMSREQLRGVLQEYEQSHELFSRFIVPVQFLVVSPDSVGFMMLYMRGGSLEDAIHNPKEGRSMSWSRKLSLAYQVARGCEYLYSCDPPVEHRDLKPANIMLNKEGTMSRISDFGLSKAHDAFKTSTSTTFAGTPIYSAPELFELSYRFTQKADVWSYGAILWELITGMKPLLNQSFAMIPAL
ncbi:hypothetical protein KIPB_001744, partial [Kipferlia bialata]|eukprot:g1744.t1